MLFDVLDKLKQQTILTSVLLMVLGLFMLVIPEQYDGTLVNIISYVIIIFALVMILDFIAGKKDLISYVFLTGALLLVLLGVFILVSGDDILKVLSVLFGVLLMIDGLHSGLHAWMYARRSGRKWWSMLLVLSIVLFALGIIIFNNPWWHTAHSFVQVIGGVILLAAVTGLIRLILVWPIKKV